MPGYKHPCRECGQLTEKTANVCPFCGKTNPASTDRCPNCRCPVEDGWRACAHCGALLTVGKSADAPST